MPKKISLANYRSDKYYPKVTAAVARVLDRKDFISPIDLFIEMKLLDPENAKRWKRGQVPYLERVIQCNLAKASRILRLLRFHAHDRNLVPSVTVYKHKTQPLRFSKSGAPPLEEAYSRHFVVSGKKRARTTKVDEKPETLDE